VQASIDRLAPVRRAREEMSGLRTRLEQLEASLAALDSEVLVGLAEAPESQEPAGTAARAAGAAVAPGDQLAGNGSGGAGALPTPASGPAAASVAQPAAEPGDTADRADRDRSARRTREVGR